MVMFIVFIKNPLHYSRAALFYIISLHVTCTALGPVFRPCWNYGAH